MQEEKSTNDVCQFSLSSIIYRIVKSDNRLIASFDIKQEQFPTFTQNLCEQIIKQKEQIQVIITIFGQSITIESSHIRMRTIFICTINNSLKLIDY